MAKLPVLIALALVACKSEREKLVDAHGARLKVQLDHLAALAPLAARAPAIVAAPETGAPAWPPPALRGARFEWGGDGAVVFEHQLAHACDEPWTTFDKDHVSGRDFIIMTSFSTDWLNNVACSVAGKNPNLADFGDQYLGEPDVQRALALKYVLAIRLRTIESPGFGATDRTFAPGRLAGDALAFELATGKLVGGFAIDVTNPPTLEFRGKAYETADQARLQLGQALQDALAARLAALH